MASVPISAITPLLVQLSRARPSPEPVTMAQATAVGAAVGEVAVGAAAGEVGALIVLSSQAQSVWAALVSVWAAMVSVWALPSATRPLTRPAGTNFARVLASPLGTAQLSD